MIETKAIVTVAEMARMCGLSRARFYQLQGKAFPFPQYDVSTRRPVYTEEQQVVCLEVRRRNCGVDGKPILFYARRPTSIPISARKSTKPKKDKDIIALIDGLASLGLTVTASQVEEVTKTMYPNGISSIDGGELVRAVFLAIRRQNTADNVGR
jgi:hypothetical protein